MLKNPSNKIPLDADSEADDCQHFYQFFLVHRHASLGKIFMKIRSYFCVKLLTDKQANKRRVQHNLLGGGNTATT